MPSVTASAEKGLTTGVDTQTGYGPAFVVDADQIYTLNRNSTTSPSAIT